MLDILKFIFQDIWHFLGVVILIGVIFEGIAEILKAIFRRRDNLTS